MESTLHIAGHHPPRRRGFTVIELLVVIGICAILVVLLLPARRDGRNAARRSQCRNNLKQIGLAIHNYAETYGCLPPAYTVGESGKPLHSWRALILPFMDQESVYKKIDFSKPWNHPANAEAYEMNIDAYACPNPNGQPLHTTYLALVGENHVFHPRHLRTLSEIADTSQTAMVIEVAPRHAVHWMSPLDTDGRYLTDLSEQTTAHGVGVHMLLADGHVHYISHEVPAEVRKGLSTIAGDDNSDW